MNNKKTKNTKYTICLNSPDTVVSVHTVYEEMLINLYELHKMDNEADYFVTVHQMIQSSTRTDLLKEVIHTQTFELEILGKYQNKQEVTA